MMKLTPDLNGARVTVARAAELAGMHPSHFRRLIRRGVFPKPKVNTKGRPYFDHDLLSQVARVIKTGIGLNGDEVMFNRRRTKPNRRGPSSSPPPAMQKDPYLADLAAILRQLGAPEKDLVPENLDSLLRSAFGRTRPSIETAVTELSQRIFGL